MVFDISYIVFLYVTVGVGLLWSLFNAWGILKIQIGSTDNANEPLLSVQKIDQITNIG